MNKIILAVLITAAYLHAGTPCPVGGTLFNYDTNKTEPCEDHNLTIDPKLDAIIEGTWNGKKYVMYGVTDDK